MAIYIAVSPLQWRWSVTKDGAIKNVLSTYDSSALKKIKLPIKLYVLNKKLNQMYKRDWVMERDTTFIATYRAISRNGKWSWYSVKHYKHYSEQRIKLEETV